MISDMHLWLASSSPRRRELLAAAGYDFKIVCAPADESRMPHETSRALVQRLAGAKADAGFAALSPDDKHKALVIGADTIVVLPEQLGGEIVGKPKDFFDACRVWEKMSGANHSVITAVCLKTADSRQIFFEESAVYFKKMSKDDMSEYWNTREPCDKAGGYAIQGIGRKFVSGYEGSFSNIVGLPMETLTKYLGELGIPHL